MDHGTWELVATIANNAATWTWPVTGIPAGPVGTVVRKLYMSDAGGSAWRRTTDRRRARRFARRTGERFVTSRRGRRRAYVFIL